MRCGLNLNTVTLWAMWKSKCVGYCISYNLNGGGGGPSTNPQKGNQTSGTITLDSNWPTRADYGFIGWCTKPTNDKTCSGEAYAPGNSYSLENGNDITLYGMWAPVTGNMQNFSCSSLANGEATALKDTRDNNIYTVAKLKDGKCWMTQNLRIVGPRNLSSVDSDVVSTYDLPASITNNSCKNNDGSTLRIYPDAEKNFGTLYGFNVATVGTARNNSIASSSVCPKNWRLPYLSDIKSLTNLYTYQTIQNPPQNFIKSGWCDRTNNQYYIEFGSRGYYWTADWTYNGNPYNIELYSNEEIFQYSASRDIGRQMALRCISR